MIHRYLTRRFIVAMTLTWLIGASMLFGLDQENKRVNEHLVELNAHNLELHKSLDQLLQRHNRVIRRVREAMSLDSAFERDSILAWAADGYPRTMETGQADLSSALLAAQTRSPSKQLTLDLDRLSIQFDRLQELSSKVSQSLTDFVTTQQADNPTPTNENALSFHRNETTWASAQQTAKATLTRAVAREQLRLTRTGEGIPPWAWLGIALPWILFWVLAPLRSLSRLASTGVISSTPSTETESGLGNIITLLRNEATQLQTQNDELRSDLAKVASTSRRQERDAALLKLYTDNLVDNLRSAITVTDPNGSINSFNLRARQLLGLSDAFKGENIDSTPLYRSLQASTQSASRTLTTILENGQLAHFEGINLQHNEQEHLLDLRVVPYLDESGSTRGLLWVADDITESVEMKNQLIATEHMATVGRISAQVAHEIRNPLSAIGLNAELLDEEFLLGLEGKSQIEARQLLAAIANEIERLNEITEGYLQLARMPRPKIQECDLNTLVTDFIAMSRPEFKNNGAEVTMRLSAEPAFTRSDPGQVRQALLNVFRNSMEAMPDGGHIQIETTLSEDACTIIVTDNGPGIPTEEIHRVFEPFYSTKTSGTGLGLSLTQQILADHGGRVEIELSAPTGTRVSLSLPRLTD